MIPFVVCLCVLGVVAPGCCALAFAAAVSSRGGGGTLEVRATMGLLTILAPAGHDVLSANPAADETILVGLLGSGLVNVSIAAVLRTTITLSGPNRTPVGISPSTSTVTTGCRIATSDLGNAA